MIGRVIEIGSEGLHLARDHGFMTVSGDGVEGGRVPLDDMAVLICNARGLTYSNGLMTELARRGIVVVLCGPNYLPGRMALAAGRPPRTGAAYALPARSVQTAHQTAVAVHSQGQDYPAEQHARSSRSARRRSEIAGATGKVRRPGKRRGAGGAAVLADAVRKRLQA